VRKRRRLYLIMMGTCVTLYVLSWTVVRLFSSTAAIIMAVVASVIPPVAVILANRSDD
jgi:amino acid permease